MLGMAMASSHAPMMFQKAQYWPRVVERIPAEAREALLAQVPLKRIGTAREVAEMVRFLAGDGAAYITGQVFHVNGGLYM